MPVSPSIRSPLQIVDIRQLIRQLSPHDRVVHQLIHRVVAAADLGGVDQRLLDPASHEPLAHGGAGMIQHPQQGASLFLVAHGFQQLQIPPGGEI